MLRRHALRINAHRLPRLAPDGSHIAYCDLGDLHIKGLQSETDRVYRGCRHRVGWLSPTELVTLEDGQLWSLHVDDDIEDIAIAGSPD